jgi:membrane carboxypeptidase/penicillin-binding protein PbpC
MREVTGLTGAAPIWHEFMRAALAGTPPAPFTRPADLQQVEICALSGRLPTDACRQRRREWFIPGTAPTQPDDLFRRVYLDPQTGALLSNAPPGAGIPVTVLDLPPQALAWGRAHDLRLLADLLPAPGAADAAAAPTVALTSPSPGAIFHLATEFAASAQRIPLEAVVAGDVTSVSFWLDDNSLGDVSAPPFRRLWTLTPGRHRVWAVAHLADGTTAQSAVIDFEVR